MRKPEGIPIVGKKLFFFLDASCCLDKHDTCATSSYTPLILPAKNNTQFAGPRAADRSSAPHGETLLPFPPRSENITERVRRQEGLRGVSGWVRTSCKDTQINTNCIQHTTIGKASALGVPREEVLGIKVLCVLAAHARSPPAAGSHRLAGADSAPHSEQNFL